MKALVIAGSLSLLFSTAVIVGTALRRPGAGQSPRDSVLEALTSTAWGFMLNYLANLALLPWVMHVHLALSDNFFMGCIYTSISVVRQLVVRRRFNAKEARRMAAQK